jgi:hypothetical protein
MFAPSSLDQQLAATWYAARTHPRPLDLEPRRGRRRRGGLRLVRPGR